MFFHRARQNVLAAGILIVALAGCAGPGEPFVQGRAANPSLRPDSTSGSDLLYISDSGTDQVYVYSYPGGTLQQTLTGFDTPLRECSDSSGNVFITNTNASQVLEYAHGASAPSATLADKDELPLDCAVDPVTHDLAVTNYGKKGSHFGSVSIYADSQGKPKKRRDSKILAYLFCAYDDSGDLFVTGLDKSYNLDLLEVPKGKSTFARIALKEQFHGWGGVRWDGKYLTIGDGAATIYRFSVKHGIAKRAGIIRLKGATNVVSYWLAGNRLIGPDGPNGGNHDVGFWRYPLGGKAVSTLTGSFENPSGVTLSLAASPR